MFFVSTATAFNASFSVVFKRNILIRYLSCTLQQNDINGKKIIFYNILHDKINMYNRLKISETFFSE